VDTDVDASFSVARGVIGMTNRSTRKCAGESFLSNEEDRDGEDKEVRDDDP